MYSEIFSLSESPDSVSRLYQPLHSPQFATSPHSSAEIRYTFIYSFDLIFSHVKGAAVVGATVVVVVEGAGVVAPSQHIRIS